MFISGYNLHILHMKVWHNWQWHISVLPFLCDQISFSVTNNVTQLKHHSQTFINKM